jgi:hypothetical protein
MACVSKEINELKVLMLNSFKKKFKTNRKIVETDENKSEKCH